MEIGFGNGGPASEAEAVAIAAAVERFLAETTAVLVPDDDRMDPWLRQGLLDGVSAKAEFGPPDPPGFG